MIGFNHRRFLARAGGTGPTWRNEFAARFLLHPPKHLEGTAERVGAPLLVRMAEHGTETDPRAAAGTARTAPGETCWAVRWGPSTPTRPRGSTG